MSAIAKVKQIYSTITRFNDEPRADPGLDRATIIDRISSVGLSPPEAVISLYEWKNGISNLDAFLHLNDLDFAVDSYKQMCAFKQEFQDFEWQRSWLPILNMNGDIHICLDLCTLALFSIDIECDSVKLIAKHFENYLDAILEIFKLGLYSFDSDAGCIFVEPKDRQLILSRFEIKSAW